MRTIEAETIRNELNLPNGKSSSITLKTPTRLDRYRERNARIDYYPSPDVLDIIRHHTANSQEPCIAGVIDGLIRAGHRAVSGNRER